MLEFMKPILDEHFFYDDGSTDDTVKIAAEMGCCTVQRPDDIPTLLQDEGLFRWGAWKALEQYLNPHSDDWILSIDCDEILIGGRDNLKEAVSRSSYVSVDLKKHEIFGYDTDGCPLVRMDGFWGTIKGPRLLRWWPNAVFKTGYLGVPGVPEYAMGHPRFETDKIELLHYGYAEEEDRQEKYVRYHGLPGHSAAHIESILGPMALRRWPKLYSPNMRKISA